MLSRKCRLCDTAGKLVKAHVIPEAFFRVLRVDGEPPILLSNTANAFPKRSPTGVYDKDILCDQCEPKFDQVDDYGTRVLLNCFHEYFHPVKVGDRIVFQGTNVDPQLLLRFLVVTLWRASVSTHPYYKRVSMGPFEWLAKQVIFNPDDPIPQEFSAVLLRYTRGDEHLDAATVLMDPLREKWGGVNTYRLYLGDVVAYVKVDSRPFPKPFYDFSLPTQTPVTLFTRDFSKSKEFASMEKIVKQAYRHQESVRFAKLKLT